MVNNIKIKLKQQFNISRIIQFVVLILIFLGILTVVLITTSIYNNYLNAISFYENNAIAKKPDPSENIDFKNFEKIIKKIEAKTTATKSESINNIFD